MKILKAFTVGWEKEKIQMPKDMDGYIRLREKCQKWVIKALLKARLAAGVGPTGSGKTIWCVELCRHRLEAYPAMRGMLIIPKKAIAHSFLDVRYEIDGRRITFTVNHNLCDGDSRQIIAAAIRFLETPRASGCMADRVMICTQQTAAILFRLRPDLFHDLFMVFDESHHCHWSESDMNGIGRIMAHAVKDQSIHVLMTTATFYRTNSTILPKNIRSQFTIYKVAHADYIEEVKPYDSLTYMMVVHEPIKVTESLGHVIDSDGPGHCGMVYAPHVRSRHSNGKMADLSDIIKAIAGTKKVEMRPNGPFTQIWSKSKKCWRNVAELVDPAKDREAVIAELTKLAKGTSDYKPVDFIIALGMLHEGYDHPRIDRVYFIGPRGSIVDINQCIGRAGRPEKGKRDVIIYTFLRAAIGSDSEDIKLRLNDVMNAGLYSMLTQNAVDPIKLNFVPKTEGGKRHAADYKRLNLDTVFNDEEELRAFHERLWKANFIWQQSFPEAAADLDKVRAHFNKTVEDELERMVLSEHVEFVQPYIWSQWQRASLQSRGKDPKPENLALLTENPVNYGIATFATASYGSGDLKSMAAYYGGVAYASLEDQSNYAVNKGIKSMAQWREHVRSLKQWPNIGRLSIWPEDQPGWRNWPSFLRINKTTASNLWPVSKFKSFLTENSITKRKQYAAWVAKNGRSSGMPKIPTQSYPGFNWVTHFTREEVETKVKGCASRTEFRLSYPKHYYRARIEGWWTEIAHPAKYCGAQGRKCSEATRMKMRKAMQVRYEKLRRSKKAKSSA